MYEADVTCRKRVGGAGEECVYRVIYVSVCGICVCVLCVWHVWDV